MKRKQPGHPIERLRGSNPRESELAKPEPFEAEFEQLLQGFSDPARALFRFARERGLLPRDTDGKPKRVPLPRP